MASIEKQLYSLTNAEVAALQIHDGRRLLPLVRMAMGVETNDMFKFFASGVLHGVSNMPARTIFDQRLGLLLSEQSRKKGLAEGVGTVFFDVVGFKKINDSYGFIAGDAVLRSIGESLKQSFRDSARVAESGKLLKRRRLLLPDTAFINYSQPGNGYHIAGDEFTAIMPAVNEQENLSTAVTRIIDNVLTSETLTSTMHGVMQLNRESNQSLTLGLRAGAVMLDSFMQYEEAERSIAVSEATDPKIHTVAKSSITYEI